MTSTKANLGPPPSKRRTLAALTAKPIEPANNMKAAEIKDLSFKVDADWHRRFKTTASNYQLSMKQVLEEAFELWVAHKEAQQK